MLKVKFHWSSNSHRRATSSRARGVAVVVAVYKIAFNSLGLIHYFITDASLDRVAKC